MTQVDYFLLYYCNFKFNNISIFLNYYKSLSRSLSQSWSRTRSRFRSWFRSQSRSQSRSWTKPGAGPWCRSQFCHISGLGLGTSPGPIRFLVPALVPVPVPVTRFGPVTQWLLLHTAHNGNVPWPRRSLRALGENYYVTKKQCHTEFQKSS